MATRTAVQALVTKTAAFNGSSVDISAVTGDWTLFIRVAKLTAAKKARLGFQDSVDAFTNNLAGPAISVKGEVGTDYDKVYSFKKQDFPSLRFGTGSAVLRAVLIEIDGSSSIDYEAWYEV